MAPLSLSRAGAVGAVAADGWYPPAAVAPVGDGGPHGRALAMERNLGRPAAPTPGGHLATDSGGKRRHDRPGRVAHVDRAARRPRSALRGRCPLFPAVDGAALYRSLRRDGRNAGRSPDVFPL